MPIEAKIFFKTCNISDDPQQSGKVYREKAEENRPHVRAAERARDARGDSKIVELSVK